MKIYKKVMPDRTRSIAFGFCCRVFLILFLLSGCTMSLFAQEPTMSLLDGRYESKFIPDDGPRGLVSLQLNWGEYVFIEVGSLKRRGLQVAKFKKNIQTFIDIDGEHMATGIRARKLNMDIDSKVELKVYTVHSPLGNNPTKGPLIYWTIYHPDSQVVNDDFEGSPGNPEYVTESGLFWDTKHSSMNIKALFTSLMHTAADEEYQDVLLESWPQTENWVVNALTGSTVYAPWQPIIVEMTVENAEVYEIAIPGIANTNLEHFFPSPFPSHFQL